MLGKKIKQKDELIPCRNNDYQRILEYDWTSGTPGLIQPKVIVSHATFSWWISPLTKPKASINSFQDIVDQRILQSDWKRNTPGHIQPKLILSREIDDQRILQSDWTRSKTGYLQQKVTVLDATFLDGKLHA